MPVPTDEATGTPTPIPTDEATGTPTPVPTDETTGTPTPVPTDEATGTPAPTDEAAGTPTPVPTDEATGTPAPAPTDEAAGTPTPVPTDAAEIKIITSFEAVAPEGLFASQGTLETDLGLLASLNAQFSDGAAGEVAVAWQCAAGYDPNAEAGTQFAFVAVLPQGYALAEGVSLPQILVTLTPPLANAMLMAATSGKGWTLSDDGKLTVTGNVMSSTIDSFESDVKSIEVIGTGRFTLVDGMSFSGDIYALEQDSFFNNGTITGGTIVGKMTNAGKITGDTISGDVVNNGEIIDGTFPGAVSNRSSITGGDFRGAIVVNESGGSITGGNFTVTSVNNNGGSITGGVFNGFTMDSKTNTLTITGDVDLSNGGSLAPLTIGLDDANIQSIAVAEGATFNAGDNTVSAPVTNRGTISGGTFAGAVSNEAGGTIAGGTFSQLPSGDGTISGGAFEGAFEIADGMLSVTGEDVDLSNIDYANVQHVGIDPGTSVSNANVPEGITVDNFGAINGGTFGGEVMLLDTGTINGGTFIGTITGSGTINAGDFTQATFSNFTGTINGGTFNGYTIRYSVIVIP